jgi:hypothetical protein
MPTALFRRGLISKALVASVVFVACKKSTRVPEASGSTTSATRSAAAEPETVLVQHRADWERFQHALPQAPDSAAGRLEAYRREYGLPFTFFVNSRAPAAILRQLHKPDDEMGCGATVTAFVKQMPIHHVVLETSPVIEFDSTGRVLSEWDVPGDVDFSELVAGVSGEEVILAYDAGRSGVYVRIRPDGRYVVSAEPPPPLEREEWIALEDSTWIRVRPRDDGTLSMHSPFTRGVDPGRWEPLGDSGWYVRTDSGPHRGAVARAITLPNTAPAPRLVSCPKSGRFEGMQCRGFPDGSRERRLAFPTPCT